ncbi:hypothetical protein MSM1_17100 [Mycobacterium sp. SM1]|nr:hypothetical protein [Mycobacterium sp. SM1]MBS4729985.1 hypothetical protein [Mycobacterium sp. SM1]
MTRTKHPKGGKPAIRVGEGDHPRSAMLPGIGAVAVREGTRRLRRMVAKQRATICFATISYHGGRWWCSLNAEAADVHPAQQHPASTARMPPPGWAGVTTVWPMCAAMSCTTYPAGWSRPTTGSSSKT